MSDTLPLSDRIEALLFTEGGSLSIKKLVQLLGCTEDELKKGLAELEEKRASTGIALVKTDTEVALTIAPAAAETIEKAFEREIGREIGDAGLEVLAIVLYRGPSTRSQIDYIRGVNTSTTIRSLSARGLLERIPNPNDAREYLYRATSELIAYLGVTEATKLPDYVKITNELAAFEAQAKSPFDTTHAATSDNGGDPQPE
jgi:segregation and condensation protein B